MARGRRHRPTEGNGDGSRSCPQIGPTFEGHPGDRLQRQIHKHFRFLARDQGCGRHRQFKIAPGTAANKMLQGNGLVEMMPPDLLEILQRKLQLHSALRLHQQALERRP